MFLEWHYIIIVRVCKLKHIDMRVIPSKLFETQSLVTKGLRLSHDSKVDASESQEGPEDFFYLT